MPKLQIRRGEASALPELSEGELGYVTDTDELYIGSSDGNVLLNISGRYATCATAYSTAAKVATTADGSEFTLRTGARVAVKFSNYSTAVNPTLNVNDTGAKSIVKYGTTASMQYMWIAGEIVEFVYDGTNWVMLKGGIATTSYYGLTKLTSTVNSSSTVLAATASAVKTAYDLANTANSGLADKMDVDADIDGGEW